MIWDSGVGKNTKLRRPPATSPTATMSRASALATVVKRWRMATLATGRNTRSRKAAKPLSSRARTDCGCTLWECTKALRKCPGKTRKLSTSEARITQMITSGMAPRMLPMRPPTSISGRKAAIVVSDDAMTGASMRRAPPSAASSGGSPIW